MYMVQMLETLLSELFQSIYAGSLTPGVHRQPGSALRPFTQLTTGETSAEQLIVLHSFDFGDLIQDLFLGTAPI